MSDPVYISKVKVIQEKRPKRRAYVAWRLRRDGPRGDKNRGVFVGSWRGAPRSGHGEVECADGRTGGAVRRRWECSNGGSGLRGAGEASGEQPEFPEIQAPAD